jgi:hypothetical protein
MTNCCRRLKSYFCDIHSGDEVDLFFSLQRNRSLSFCGYPYQCGVQFKNYMTCDSALDFVESTMSIRSWTRRLPCQKKDQEEKEEQEAADRMVTFWMHRKH